MATTDPRVNAYIAKASAFAKPVLEHLRKLVHKACPDAEETIKWGFPHFDYKGTCYAVWRLLNSIAPLAFGRLPC
jgi:uncharacterized protein YdhG (YjbR/CyaY superfamily)